MEWYGVRTVVRWGDCDAYEERLTIWRASSADQAIELAERDAVKYAEIVSGRYAGLAQSYLIGPEQPGHGDEVYSLLRASVLDPDEYLSTYFDTGAEHTAG